MDHDPYFRYPVHVNAKLFSTELRVPIDCVIRNLSEEGAQLALKEPASLPRRVYLSPVKGGCVFECDVRWWKSNRLFGIRFSPNSNREARHAFVESARTPEGCAMAPPS